MNPSDIVQPNTGKKAGASPSRTALIVDDEESLLRLMVRLLERAEYQVWAAKDGTQARALFQEHEAEIDLALIDVVHPPGAGAEDLLPELLQRRPDLDVILTSGDVLSSRLEEILDRIGGRFLRKPFVPKALLRLLDEKRGSEEAKPGAVGQSSGPGVV